MTVCQRTPRLENATLLPLSENLQAVGSQDAYKSDPSEWTCDSLSWQFRWVKAGRTLSSQRNSTRKYEPPNPGDQAHLCGHGHS